jgi:uncharacterized protein YbbC (DUF1343 family)
MISCAASNQNEANRAQSNPEIINEPEEIISSNSLFCNAEVKVGAERTELYLEQLKGARVGIVGNQTSTINGVHLVDSLISLGIKVVKVFSPEHGFRGTADAGEKVNNELDAKTGLPLVSLYGKNKKPTAEQLADLDILVFDIQDVGVRFYTYISTLHYVMEAAAESGKRLIVLDRPNPNGHYVDGPVLKDGFTSFIGMHKIPVIHGMSIGEFAKMLNGEKWLKKEIQTNLEVIPCSGWDHTKFYNLPIAPSPNLPNMRAIYLYPSLCFFEGTIVSVGRGTEFPFQIAGHPKFIASQTEFDTISFTPMPSHGAKNPLLNGLKCVGIDLHELSLEDLQNERKLNLSFLFEFYKNTKTTEPFFLANNFLDLLYGSDFLRKEILKGTSLSDIENTWKEDLENFQIIRKKYLLYQDF